MKNLKRLEYFKIPEQLASFVHLHWVGNGFCLEATFDSPVICRWQDEVSEGENFCVWIRPQKWAAGKISGVSCNGLSGAVLEPKELIMTADTLTAGRDYRVFF